MAKAIALYTGGIHNLVEMAIREDGVVFRRDQDRTPWGYRWSKWSRTGKTLGHNARSNPPHSFSAGFASVTLQTCRSYLNKKGEVARRLPND